MEKLSTLIFALAIGHIFLVARIRRLSELHRKGSLPYNLLHLLGEVEIVFALWSAIFLLIWMAIRGTQEPLAYIDSIHFSEAVLVFVIMTQSATRPVLSFVQVIMSSIAAILPLPPAAALAASVLTLGPLLGSLITEPAAMTVSAFLLLPIFSSSKISGRTKYLLLGLLLVNISIGGTLTHFAAPPVLIIARPWGWDTLFMLQHLGWRAACAVLISSAACTVFVRRELGAVELKKTAGDAPPFWTTAVNIGFIALAILSAQHVEVLFAVFLFFLGWTKVSSQYQDELKLKGGLLVGVFLAGLVVLGGMQSWWITPVISGLSGHLLFFGTLVLTAFADNALLTYLGTLVPDLSKAQELSLVGGAVCGGGLSVIANAPNPIAFCVLGESFGESGIDPFKLFLGALVPTLIAAVFFLI